VSTHRSELYIIHEIFFFFANYTGKKLPFVHKVVWDLIHPTLKGIGEIAWLG
jgi:hypothetical protein